MLESTRPIAKPGQEVRVVDKSLLFQSGPSKKDMTRALLIKGVEVVVATDRLVNSEGYTWIQVYYGRYIGWVTLMSDCGRIFLMPS